MDLLSGNVPPEAVKEKIVLIGVGAQSVKDFFYTPFSRGFDEAQQVPGVVLHGYIASQLLRFALDGSRPIAYPPSHGKTLWLLLWCVAGALGALWSRSAWRFTALSGGGLAIICGSAYCAFLARWWIPLVPPAIAFVLAAAVATAYMTSYEKRERSLLMQIFSRHVSKEIAETIWQERDKFLNNGRPRSQKLTATVFFSDMRGFTSMSEKMDPKELIDWLNIYMESMAQLIMEYGGVVDDYAGDGIKANFGVPIPRGDDEEVRRDAENAIACALAMGEEMAHLNARWRAAGLPAMGIRVGIFTGPVVAGLLGSSQRLKYTTVGDTVNIASRLESHDKEVGKERPCRILIGESTFHHVHSCFRTERIGALSLKGKEERITVYQVLGREEHRDPSDIRRAVEL
jgi:adenylate cyclase